jgi:hypothetical protein
VVEVLAGVRTSIPAIAVVERDLNKSREHSCPDVILSTENFSFGDPLLDMQQPPGVLFMCGTVIWLDVILASTAGTIPKLLIHHSDFAASLSQADLLPITECSDDIVNLIGRIATVYV